MPTGMYHCSSSGQPNPIDHLLLWLKLLVKSCHNQVKYLFGHITTGSCDYSFMQTPVLLPFGQINPIVDGVNISGLVEKTILKKSDIVSYALKRM